MHARNELIITRGLPGSGKTKWALEQIKRGKNMVHVSRDMLRAGVFDKQVLDASDESIINSMQSALIRRLLLAKKNVIVDNTHLSQKSMNNLYSIAQEFEGQVSLRIVDFPVEVKTCIRRDSERANPVGEKAIRNMASRYLRGGKDLPELPAKFYEPISPLSPASQDEELPSAWIVDVDNTLAKMVNRGPFDWSKVGDDLLVQHVYKLVLDLHASGHKIIIVTGRDGVAAEMTELWLKVNDVPYDEFYIREAGDMRPDNIFKAEVYENNLKGRYYIAGVLDDRQKVVTMWREKGLFAAQVAPGLF